MITERANDIALGDWLRVLERNYLDGYIDSGGAAVKVAVVDPGHARHVADAVAATAQNRGYIAAHIDPSVPRLHLIDRLFTAVARYVDWDGLARDYVSAGMRSLAGYRIPSDGGIALEHIAAESGVDLAQTKLDFRRLTSDGLMRDAVMTQDFKLAMRQLCNSLAEPDEPNVERAHFVKQWLRGELPRIGALKDSLIFQKINRHNARHMFASTGAWVKYVGRAGLVVTVDLSACSREVSEKSPAGEILKPVSRATAIDSMELVREFIDGTDELTGLLLVFITRKEFLEDGKHGYRLYPALWTRLVDDVRDRRRANPLAPMVRLAVQ